MRIINLTNNKVLADRAKVADTFWPRLIGLLNRSSLDKGEALILKPSLSIHTMFMRFSIDVLFLDRKGTVIAKHPSFKPFRFSPFYLRANVTIELPEGAIESTQTRVGDVIQITQN